MVGEEDERKVAGRAVALLRDDHVRDPLALRVAVVELLAVEKDDDVGVLLDRARVAQVRELGLALVALALFRRARELRERHDRHLQLLGE